MNIINDLINYFLPFLNGIDFTSVFMMFGLFSFVFFIFAFAVWSYAFYYCIKNEKDISKRNIWLGIIIAGKFLGAATYLTLEKFFKKK